ncbi:MAG: hypothetical protein WEG40_13380 [Candidatus Rokuibacteriota bacterium]
MATRIPIRVAGEIYSVRLWSELTPEEHAEWLAVQLEMHCPEMPVRVRQRLTFGQLWRISRLVFEQEAPVFDGAAVSIDHPQPGRELGEQE